MKKDRILILLLLILWVGIFYAFAQTEEPLTVEVTGQVFDDLGVPVEGVLLTNNAGIVTVTNQSGEFVLQSNVIDVIAFEIEGYETVLVNVLNGTIQDNEIIVKRAGFFNPQKPVNIPFKKISPVSSTGSVIRVSGQQLQKHPSGLVLEALTGLIPGLQIMQTSSRPGLESYNVRYHGSSVTILVDGLPVSQDLGLLAIDEVVFLRGAAATAFMGEIGADGLLNIITKRGINGPRKIMAQVETSVGLPTSMTDMQNSYQYAQTINRSLVSDGLPAIYSQQDLDAYNNQSDPVRYPDVNYQDLVYRDFISRQQYTAQVFGGDDRTRYFANFDYNGKQGMENSADRRINEDFRFRSNIDVAVTDFLHLDLALTGAYKAQHSTRLASGTTMQNVMSIPPNEFPLMLGDSIYITSRHYGTNLKYEMDEGGYQDETDRAMKFNLGISLDLSQVLDGLSFNVRGSGDVWNQSILRVDNDGAEYELIFEPQLVGGDTMLVIQTDFDDPQFSPSSEGTNVNRRFNYSGLLSYSKTFGVHSVDASALAYLYELQLDDNIDLFRSQSFNTRGSYVFDDKYTAEIILNYSGTNKINEGNRYRLFPTAGVSWILSNESFLVNNEGVDFLKLRGSWGQQGYFTSFNNYYSFLDHWSHSNFGVTFGAGNTTSTHPISELDQTGTSGLNWPVKTTINLGLDGLFLNNSLSMHVDYFNFKKSGLISRGVTMDLAGGNPYYTYSNQNEEIGNAIELGMNYYHRTGDFSYTIGANIGYTKSIRSKFVEPAYENISDLREGDDTDAIYGLTDSGLFASDEDAMNSNQNFGSVFGQDIIYQDINNDGIVDNMDRDVIGNSDPRINYGININVSYKQISLYVNGAGFAGYDINLNNNSQYQISGFDSRPVNMYNNLPNGNSAPRLTVLGSNNNFRSSTYWLVPGNYFRIENFELVYHFPANMAERWFINNAKIFVRGKNLLIFSNFNDSDPEFINGGYRDYPLFREISTGVKFSF